MGVIFAGFALFWMVQALHTGAGFLALAGLPFLVIGIGLARAPFRRAKRGAETVYAITDRRLLVLSGGSTRRVRSFGPEDINTLERREHDDGSGDVIFRRELRDLPAIRRHDHRPRYRRRRERRIGFFNIPDVRRVEAAVMALRDGQAAS